MGFKSLFKVRRPGNGQKVQDALMSKKTGPEITNKGSKAQNGGDKTSV